MDHSQAVNFIRTIRSGKSPELTFIAPAVATILAAYHVFDSKSAPPIFLNQAQTYAATIGLLDVIDGRIESFNNRVYHGQTYSKLMMLFDGPHVDDCCKTINSVFRNQLSDYDRILLCQLEYVVGELHDNVVSHSRGAGFSAAQTYGLPGGKPGQRVIFSIADSGVGLLANVKKVLPTMTEHDRAIEWCLQKGNTTARPLDKFAQSTYSDAVRNPFGSGVKIRERECNHQGFGLAELCDIVDKTDGKFWMWTGDSEYSRQKGVGYFAKSEAFWQGLAVELELHVTPETKAEFEGFGIEDVFSGR